MSALNRVKCPHCAGEVMLLRGAANRRWICCHCEGIIDLDVLEGVGGEREPADATTFEWEPLPTAHAAPPATPPPDLGDAPDIVALSGVTAYSGLRTERERNTDQAMRRQALVDAAKRSRLVSVMTVIFYILGFAVFFYPARLDEQSLLPPLNAYFQARPVIFPYFLASPRIFLGVLLLVGANGIYYGKTWAPPLSAAALFLTCVAFNFHPVVILISAVLLYPLWLLRREIRFTRL